MSKEVEKSDFYDETISRIQSRVTDIGVMINEMNEERNQLQRRGYTITDNLEWEIAQTLLNPRTIAIANPNSLQANEGLRAAYERGMREKMTFFDIDPQMVANMETSILKTDDRLRVAYERGIRENQTVGFTFARMPSNESSDLVHIPASNVGMSVQQPIQFVQPQTVWNGLQGYPRPPAFWDGVPINERPYWHRRMITPPIMPTPLKPMPMVQPAQQMVYTQVNPAQVSPGPVNQIMVYPTTYSISQWNNGTATVMPLAETSEPSRKRPRYMMEHHDHHGSDSFQNGQAGARGNGVYPEENVAKASERGPQ